MACCPQSLMKSLGHWTLQAHRPRKSGHGARKWLPLHAHFSLHGGAVLPASNLQGWSARSKTRSMLWRRVISAKRPFSVKPQSTNIPHHQLCALPLLCVSASSLSIALCQCILPLHCFVSVLFHCFVSVQLHGSVHSPCFLSSEECTPEVYSPCFLSFQSPRLQCTLRLPFPVESGAPSSFPSQITSLSVLSSFPFSLSSLCSQAICTPSL